MFFSLSDWELALVLAGILFGATFLGLLAGRALSRHRETLSEPLGVVQGALLTLVGLVLAFGLAMAVARYEARRAAVIDDANAIGTAYLRAQTLANRPAALARLYAEYTQASLGLSTRCRAAPPRSVRSPPRRTAAAALAPGRAGPRGPACASAPRLYVESLNEMIDMRTPGLGPQQPRPRADPPGRGGRSRARRSGSSPSTSRCSRAASSRSCSPRAVLDAAPDQLRPRPAGSWVHQHPHDVARRTQGLDGAAAGGRRAGPLRRRLRAPPPSMAATAPFHGGSAALAGSLQSSRRDI